jgi:dTMP kinase
MSRNGLFITLEGGEGAGKSTLARALASALADTGRKITLTREPGGSPRAEALRAAILSGTAKPYGAGAEALLFYAARDDHLKALIRPALARGDIVICDRFSDSTRAYQGAAGRTSAQLLQALERLVVGIDKPDLTLMLDLPPEAGLKRAAGRMAAGEAKDRFESEQIGFHRRLRRAFLDIAAAEPERCVVIDAAGSPDSVAELAEEAIRARLAPRLQAASPPEPSRTRPMAVEP